jgi:hypothetical protein
MDCLTYHYDIGRSGAAPSSPVGAYWFKYFAVNLGSAVRGAPLVVSNWTFQSGPNAGQTHNLVIVATSDNRVLAYSGAWLRTKNAATLWSRNLGAPVNVPGSNIPNPIGVCSTPVLDPANRRMFVMAAEADAGAGGQAQYRCYCLDLDTGVIVQSALLQDVGAVGRPTFDGHTLDQRAALNLVNGMLYAGFAAYLAYDLGPYHGRVVSLNSDNLYDQWFFPITRSVSPSWNTVYGGGVWGPGGVAAAPDGTLYVGTGNGKFGPDGDPNAAMYNTNYWSAIPASGPGSRGDYFIAVLKLGVTWSGWTGSLTALGWYHPPDARAQNDADLDFGSSSPLILPDIAGMQLLVIAPKAGIYLLNRATMTGLWSQKVFTGESHSAPGHYLTPTGDHYVYFVGQGLPGLICYRVDATGTTASLNEIWRANIDAGDAHGSPTIGTFGSGAAVWIVQWKDVGSSILRAYDALSGVEVYNSATSAADDLGPVPHFAPITVSGANVYVGNNAGFACYGPPVIKRPKELKPEIKELKPEIKEFKPEIKELKREIKELIPEKQLFEPPKFKDIVEGGGILQPGGDPYSIIRTMAGRIDELEDRLAQQPFIREEERPQPAEPPAVEPPSKGQPRRARGGRARGSR